MTTISRRLALGGGIAMASAHALAAAPEVEAIALQDFDELWTTLAERYGFFGLKTTDWRRVRSVYRPLAQAVDNEAEYVEVLRHVLAELYDPHTHLANQPAGSPRYPPYDLWVELRGDAARIIDVRRDSGAASAGIEPGETVIAVDGVPVLEAASKLRARCLKRPDPDEAAYALQSAVSGLRERGRRLTVEGPTGRREVQVPAPGNEPEAGITHRLLPGDYGYIRIPTFADQALVVQFDAALSELANTRGMILDVRENGGGDTAVGRPMMGRFIAERRPYATMRRRQGAGLSAPWTEWVEPRGPFRYAKPVAVLVNRWSGSMAEGFPMGLRAIAGARLVGTEMMGLGAAVYQLRLDRTGVQAQYSGEPVYTIAGEPRWLIKPDLLVRPTTLHKDEVLDAAIGDLRSRT